MGPRPTPYNGVRFLVHAGVLDEGTQEPRLKPGVLRLAGSYWRFDAGIEPGSQTAKIAVAALR